MIVDYYLKGQYLPCTNFFFFHISIGIRCDVFSHFYSYSTDLKYDWDDLCSTQPGILAYLKDVIRKYRLESHIVLNTKVVVAEWQSGIVMNTGVPWGVFGCPVPVPAEFPSRSHGCGIPAEFPRA